MLKIPILRPRITLADGGRTWLTLDTEEDRRDHPEAVLLTHHSRLDSVGEIRLRLVFYSEPDPSGRKGKILRPDCPHLDGQLMIQPDDDATRVEITHLIEEGRYVAWESLYPTPPLPVGSPKLLLVMVRGEERRGLEIALRGELARVFGDDWGGCEPTLVAASTEIPEVDDDLAAWCEDQLKSALVIVTGGQQSFSATSHDPVELMFTLGELGDAPTEDDEEEHAAEIAAAWEALDAIAKERR